MKPLKISTLALVFILGAPALPLQAGIFDRAGSALPQGQNSTFLKVEDAFKLEASLKETTLTLTWIIEPEHYLYRSRFKLASLDPKDIQIKALNIPRGKQVHDEFQGDVEILRGKVVSTYQLERAEALGNDDITLEVTFQGCADAGLCYPPHRQKLTLSPIQ